MKNLRFCKFETKTVALRTLAILLSLSTIVANVNAASASDLSNIPTQDNQHARWLPASQEAGSERQAYTRRLQADDFDKELSSEQQVLWPAAACYTFAGPICSMAVPVAPGSPCTCYNIPGYPPLQGIAY